MKYKKFSEEIWQKIRLALAEEKKINQRPIAAFDADGTLWDTDLGESFFKYQISNRLLNNLPNDPWEKYRREKDKADPRPAYLWLAQINQGQDLAQVRDWAELAVKAKEPLPIFEDQKKLITYLLSENVQIWIVTASVKWAVEPGAKRLGLDFENVIGVETMVQNGVIQNSQHGEMTYREGKLRALLQKTRNVRPFLACGNTLGDLTLIEGATRVQLAVGASTLGHDLYEAEEKLRKEAQHRGWLLHQF